jgi:hypothetical protein
MINPLNDYKKIEFIKNHHNSVNPQLTANTITNILLPKFDNEHRKLEVIDFFQNFFEGETCKVLNCMDQFENEHRRFDILKLLCGKITVSSDELKKIILKFTNEHRRFDVVELYANSSTFKNIFWTMELFDNNSRKIDIVKLLQGNKCDGVGISIENVYEIMEKMTTENGKIDLIEYYKKSFAENNIANIILIMNTSEGKLRVIQTLDNINYTEPFNLIDYIDKNDESVRMKLFQYIIEKYEKYGECVNKFKSTGGKLRVIKIMNLSYLYDTNKSLTKLLNIFDDDDKLKVLKKKLLDTQEINHSLIKTLLCFVYDSSRLKGFKLFLKNTDIKNKKIIKIMEMFLVDNRYGVLNEYVKSNAIKQYMLPKIIGTLESSEKAFMFLKKHKYEDINGILETVGYNVTDEEIENYSLSANYESDSESDSESSSESEGSMDGFERYDDNTIKVDLGTVNFSHHVRSNLRNFYPSDKVLYNEYTETITDYNGRGNSYCSITIGGVNIGEQAKKDIIGHIKRYKKEHEKREKKKNKLKVPHAWRDIRATAKTDDNDICNICMTNKRQIIFNCGHYHTCGHCTRLILKGNKECPICRREIKNVTHVFA